MPTILYYLGISALFTHELDAVINMEWRLLYHLRTLPDVTASSLFIALHFPFFFLFLFLSHHKATLIKERFRLAVCIFLVVHGILHFRLSNEPLYSFEGFLSNTYIAGASLLGLLFTLRHTILQKQCRIRSRQVMNPIRSFLIKLPKAGLACALLTIPTLALSQTALMAAAPESVGVSSQRLELIDTMLQQHIDDGRVPGLVAGVARHGKIVFLKSYGWQDIEARSPMQDNSIFQIRSMSKPITAMAALQLVEKGKISLSDPVSKYIPSFSEVTVFNNPNAMDLNDTRAPSREITVEDLLLNTAGLSHRFSALYRENEVRSRADTLEQLADKVAAIPLIGDPGQQWVYSISITLLGRIIEIASGQAFDTYLDENLFGPLAMVDTGFYVKPNQLNRLARAYKLAQPGQALELLPPMAIPITQKPALMEGAAGILSTVPDYLRFLQALLNHGELNGQRILSAASVNAATTNHIPDKLLPIGTNPNAPMLDRGWGYGLSVVVDESKSPYGANNGEFGWAGSLGTQAWADPETDMAVVIMLQVQPSSAYAIVSKFKAMVYQSVID
jgi:CubicO group peptidase (beta-lactamase class C family)